MMLIEKLVDGGAHVLAKSAGLLAAPGRRALEERRLLGRVVIPIRLPLAGSTAQMRFDQLRADVETNEDLANPDVEGLADVPPGDGVEAALHLDVAIACDLACAQVTISNGVVGRASMVDCSIVWNSSNGAACVVPWSRGPATRRHHRSAPVLISSRLPNARPVQKLSRTKGICRSTRGLSFGFRDLAGSIKQPK